MDRGGPEQGDNYSELQGTNLINEIGFALQVQLSDPTNWSEYEISQALQSNLSFFKGESLAAINIVFDQILKVLNHPSTVLMNVLPVIFIPENNKKKFKPLPPGAMMFPQDGHLTRDLSDGGVLAEECETPSARFEAKAFSFLDKAIGVTGIVSAVGSIVFSGGIVIVFVTAGVVAAIYSTVKSICHLYDRVRHGQSINPFTDYTAFTL